MIHAARKLRLGKALTTCSLALVTVGAFVLRALNHSQIFSPNGIRFIGSDALYHMHRVHVAAANGLRVPAYDPFMNFPQGFHCNWPPLFDQCIAAIALVIGAGTPSIQLIDTVGALVPPVLGALTVLAMYPVARTYTSGIGAICTCAVFAILPFHVQISALGRPDHHVAVVFICCLLMTPVLALPRLESNRKLVAVSVLAGFLLFLALNIWVGSLLIAVVLAIHFALSFAARIRQPVKRERVGIAAACTFLSAAVFLWPTATTTHWARVGYMKWDALCDFHVLLLGGCAVGFLTLCVLWPASPRGPRRAVAIKAGAIVLALGFGCVMYLFGFFDIIAAGPSWVLKGDPMLKQVVETMPLSWRTAQENFSRLVVLFPLILAVAVRATWRKGNIESGILLAVWSIVIGICTLSKERFADLFSLNAAILIAFALEYPFRGYKPRAGSESERTPAVTAALTATVIAVAAYALIPPFAWLKSYSYSAPRLSPQPLYDLCSWLRQNTEPPEKGPDGAPTPSYSILAGWQLGNAITALAGRANVANNFLGWKENREANLAPYRLAVSDDPSEVERILRSYGVRYLVIGEPVVSGDLARAVEVLGLRHEDFFISTETEGRQHFKVLPRALRSAAVKLYMGNGSGLVGFSLIHVSREEVTVAGRRMPAHKVFKYTPPEH